MQEFATDAQRSGVEALVANAGIALVRRRVVNPPCSPEAIAWAASCLLDDPVFVVVTGRESSAGAVKRALAHLAAQRTALDTAYAQLSRRRGIANQVLEIDEIHQAYVELLRALPRHGDWCCADGSPSADVARAQLRRRGAQRKIDDMRRRASLVTTECVDDWPAAPVPRPQPAEVRELTDRLRRNFPVGDHMKLDRLILHAIFDLPHETIARASGMSHTALRAESSRLARRIRPLFGSYERGLPRHAGDTSGRDRPPGV